MAPNPITAAPMCESQGLLTSERFRESEAVKEDCFNPVNTAVLEEDEKTSYVWTLSDELADIALKELGEDKKVRDASLLAMRRWIRHHPDIVSCRTDNIFLLRFLRSQKFRLDRTQKVLENYLRMRCENPDWFTNLDPTTSHVEDMCDSGFSLVLPNRDCTGRRILLSYVSKIDLKNHGNGEVMKTMMVNLETLMANEENQIRGISYIFYCKGVSLSHLSIWTPAEAARLFGTCEKNLGVRHSDINLVRMPFTMWAVIEFVKQFLSAKIKSRIRVFSDEKKLAQKLGNLTMLPEELGGEGKTLPEMAKRWKQELWQNRPQLLAMDNLKINLTSSDKLQPASPDYVAPTGFMTYLRF